MRYGVKVSEIRNGSKTFDKKDELKTKGFAWTEVYGDSYKAWVKAVESPEAACDVMKELTEMGFGSFFGVVATVVKGDKKYDRFYYRDDAEKAFPKDKEQIHEAGRVVYEYRKTHHIS